MAEIYYTIALFLTLCWIVLAIFHVYEPKTNKDSNSIVFLKSIYMFFVGYTWCMAFFCGITNKLFVSVSIVSGILWVFGYLLFRIINNNNNEINKDE